MSYVQIMCLILNCSSARSIGTPAEAAQAWVHTYQLGGLRSDLTPAQRLWAKSQVIQLQLLVAADQGVLSPELKHAFSNSLTSILLELDP